MAIALAAVMLPISVTGPGVALADMSGALNASAASTQWVLNAYNVAFTAFMLAAGSAADLFGRRRLFLTGTTVFALASLVAGTAPSIWLVDVARFVQGMGAAAVLTSGSALLAHTFTGTARARAFGIFGASIGFGLAMGPFVSGLLVGAASWRAVFLVNVLLGAVVLVLAWPLSESKNPGARRIDMPGVLTFTAALMLLALGFVEGPSHGWAGAPTLGSFAGAAVFLAAFVFVELRSSEPMFDLSLLRRPTFVAIIWQPVSIVFAFAALLVYLPPYFQGVGGASSTVSGAMLLPLTLPVFILPLFSGALVKRLSVRMLLAIGPAVLAAALLLMTLTDPVSSPIALFAALLVAGIGIGLAFGVMDNAAVSSVPPERSGMASGMFNTLRVAGETIGVACVAGLLLTSTRQGLGGAADSGAIADDVVQGRLDSVREAGGAELAHRAVLGLEHGWTTVYVLLACVALAGSIAIFTMVRDRDLDQSGG
ncbi:MFS transporter [Nocardiopsis gilva YIM 90087]|uniref:MFS transporter n=1 Tax=Nocardiopsis gilva YIM 90087 TaxID=1235441 RepID=A0A223S181_9ACTN|nr:MFS transporter [Nocardiopsis gilva]ASU81885.1 MFS transporter [Nocardiopsis gilva YIM 90087]